jgi:hypothetical protein
MSIASGISDLKVERRDGSAVVQRGIYVYPVHRCFTSHRSTAAILEVHVSGW